jgi:hypothetical protein
MAAPVRNILDVPSYCAVSFLCMFKITVFHLVCYNSSFFYASYQLLPSLELTLWYILDNMQPHREKSNGFRLVNQFGHSNGQPFLSIFLNSFQSYKPQILLKCRGVLQFYIQICHLVSRTKFFKLIFLYEKFL